MATSDSPKVQDTDPNIVQIQKIILALDRTVRSQRIYAPTNPVLIRHLQELTNQFSIYLGTSPELSLLIEPYEFRVGETVVYSNNDERESFAFRLFNDGIRSISFKEGLTQDEIREFITALNAQIEDATHDSDAVTLFWEREFEHLTYSVADAIVDEPTYDEKSTDEKIKELVEADMSHYRGATETGDEDVYEDLPYKDFKVTLNMNSMGKIFQQRTVLTQEDLEIIQKDIAASDRPERLVLDFVDMLLAVLQEEADATDFDRTMQALGSVLDNNLMQSRLNIARMIMEQVHRLPERVLKVPGNPQDVLTHSLNVLWPQARVDLFIQSLNQDSNCTPEDVERVVSLMPAETVSPLLKLLPTVVDSQRRRSVAKGIAALHKGDLGLYIPMLASKDEETVKSAIFILSHIKNDKIIDILTPMVQHRSIAIQREAIDVLKHFKGPKALKAVAKMLQDEKEDIRISGLRLLSTAGDKSVAQQLLSTMNREDFLQKSMQERKAYFYSVAKLASDDFIPFLQDLLSSRTWLRKANIEEQYQLAAYGLSVIGTPKARSVLSETAKSKNKFIRRLSENALRLLEGGRPAA